MSRLDVVPRVGAALRALRLRRDMTGEELGDALGWSQAKVSRVELGRLGITVPDLIAALDALGATTGERAELLSLASSVGDQGWIVRNMGTGARQGAIAHLETSLSMMREYHPLVVPGLVQSRAYTVAMATSAGFAEAEEIADARQAAGGVIASRQQPPPDEGCELEGLCAWRTRDGS